MSESCEPGRGVEAGAARQQIHVVRDFVELVWSQGGSPDLAEFLQWVAPAHRVRLFESLFNRELQLCRARGETPTCDDYVTRFPAYESEIRAAFAHDGETLTHTPLEENIGQLEETEEVCTDTKSIAASPSQASERRGPTKGEVRYRVLRPHAKGGLGEVYVAHDEELNREVALKEILPKHADNPNSRSRFLLEAEVTGSLEHPGIVPVYGLVMPTEEGSPL